jgi:DNA-binding CsgD family transcriptional regulator
MGMLFGPRADLLDAVAEVRREADELREWFTAWNSRQSPAVMLVSAGRLDEGEALVADLRSARAVLIRAVAEQMRGRVHASLALVADAHELLDARLGAALDRVLVAFATAGAALAMDDRSGLDALRLADVSLETLPPGFTSAYVMATGVQQLVEGRLLDARATFAGHQPDIFTSWRLMCLLAQTELALGDREAARTAARRVLEQTVDVPAPLYETIALLVLAECIQLDDVNAALDDAHRALAVAAGAGLWPSVVDALEAIGVMLVEVGRERDGARALGAAAAAREAMSYRYRFAHRATAVAAATAAVGGDAGWAEGASLLLPEAVELVQRMRGERVRPVIGWDSLTPTEMQVVEQVAAGLTNPQIAERLLMSRATVKTHLVHVYSKLGIGSRAELAAAAVRRSRR